METWKYPRDKNIASLVSETAVVTLRREKNSKEIVVLTIVDAFNVHHISGFVLILEQSFQIFHAYSVKKWLLLCNETCKIGIFIESKYSFIRFLKTL